LKKVLIIAFYFPPLGGGGVQRPLKFVKYLREFGWEPVVLTIKPFRLNYARDHSLLKEIPKDIKIYKAPYFNISRFPLMGGTTGKYLYKPFEKRYLLPDKEIVWNRFAISKAMEIIKEENIDVIFTTMPPNSINLIGEKLKRLTNLPWVCDIRDEWTSDQKRKKHFDSMNRERVQKEKEMELRSLGFADKLTIISDLAKNRISNFNNIPLNKINIISNGYDSKDFQNYTYQYPSKGGKLKIVHPGNLSTREFDSFLIALKNLEQTKIIDPNKIEIVFITSSGKKRITKINNSSIIKFLPYQDHKKLLTDLSNYHLLLLNIGKNEQTIVTGKIFEYLYARRIIFAIIPKDGVAANIIRECNAGIISSSENIPEIEKNLLDVYRLWENNKLNYAGVDENIKQYDRRFLTEKLADTFNSLMESDRDKRVTK